MERGDVVKFEKLTAAECGKHYLASQTYGNIFTLFRGFVEFTWCILNHSDCDKILPALYCKQ